MKNLTISITVLGVFLAAIWPAYARDTKHILPIAVAMAIKDADEKLEGSVKFSLGSRNTRRLRQSSALMYPIARPMRLASPMKKPATGRSCRR
jgi:hypothetical protein